MKRAWLLSSLILLAVTPAFSDSSNLEGGVFIAHHPPGLQYSEGENWCARYFQDFAIDSCSEQNNRIDIQGDYSVWFVLAAWAEEKEWCGAEFGFGDYAPDIYAFTHWGPCSPAGAMEVPMTGWPGPNRGTVLTIQDTPWSGRFIPIYWFAGYAYAEGIIWLAENPATEFGGTCNCMLPPQTWSAEQFGGMGLFRAGGQACPGPPTSPPPPVVCCSGGECELTSATDCASLGGTPHPEWDDCEPNPCSLSPALNLSWGLIKSLYRSEDN
jgi:hypothetical protein